MRGSTKKIIVVVASLLAVIVFVILLSSVFGKQKMPVDSTVKVEFSGKDGYGIATICDEWDWMDKIKFKRSKNNTPSEIFAYKMVLNNAVSYSLSKSENLSNGDVVKVKISVDNDMLKQYGLKAKDVTKRFKVSGLGKAKKIDPFKEGKLDYSIYGISGVGSLNESGYCIIDLGKDETLELNMKLQVKTGENGKLANGDVIHAKITSEEKNSYLANNYGIVLTKRETDIVINNMDYYPIENPKEIFKYLSDEDLQNVLSAVESKYVNHEGNIKAEYVGAIYYYADEVDYENRNHNKNNQLALIYHVENGIKPGGWYTYMALKDEVYIEHREAEDGTLNKVTVRGYSLGKYDSFAIGLGGYNTDRKEYWNKSEIATSFDYNGLTYEGHQTLEECVNAFVFLEVTNEKNLWGEIIENTYDHVIATEKLEKYIK